MKRKYDDGRVAPDLKTNKGANRANADEKSGATDSLIKDGYIRIGESNVPPNMPTGPCEG